MRTAIPGPRHGTLTPSLPAEAVHPTVVAPDTPAPAVEAALLSVVSEGGHAEHVRQVVADAVRTGVLVESPCPGVLVPVGDRPEPPPGALSDWWRAGYRPFRCKPGPWDPAKVAALRVLFAELPRVPDLRCVPHWVVPGLVLSLQLPGASDLRPAPGTPAGDAGAVHEVCLSWLEQAAAADERLRAALTAAGAPEPSPFPVAARYQWAVGRLTRTFGDPGLPPDLPLPSRPGRSVLFWDPKPANFIVPAAERPRLGPGGSRVPARVDLDHLHQQCPLSLQILLVLFSHPVVVPGPGPVPPADAVDALLSRAEEAADRMVVPRSELDAMVLYHLTRNLVSAAEPPRPEPAKARALAPLLAAALRRSPLADPDPALLARLDRWSDPAAGDGGTDVS